MSFRRSLVSKYVSSNNNPCMNRPTSNFYPFIVSLDKSNGICNAVDDLSMKICALSEIKDVNVKVYNMMKIN